MVSNALLISIHPKYANKIFDGTKTVELRRVRPKLTKGDLVLIYITSPVKSLAGAFKVDKVLGKEPKSLWKHVKNQCGTSKKEFNKYFEGVKIGYGIFFSEVWKFSTPIDLNYLKKRCPNFTPPQGYHYFDLTQEDKEINNTFNNILKEESMV